MLETNLNLILSLFAVSGRAVRITVLVCSRLSMHIDRRERDIEAEGAINVQICLSNPQSFQRLRREHNDRSPDVSGPFDAQHPTSLKSRRSIKIICRPGTPSLRET